MKPTLDEIELESRDRQVATVVDHGPAQLEPRRERLFLT
jgi:hypothetical protein